MQPAQVHVLFEGSPMVGVQSRLLTIVRRDRKVFPALATTAESCQIFAAVEEKPTHIALHDIVDCRRLNGIDTEPYCLNVIFSIIPAFEAR
jgi:hypothetical protein